MSILDLIAAAVLLAAGLLAIPIAARETRDRGR